MFSGKKNKQKKDCWQIPTSGFFMVISTGVDVFCSYPPPLFASYFSIVILSQTVFYSFFKLIPSTYWNFMVRSGC